MPPTQTTEEPNFETLWKLANALDMRPSELVALIEHEIESGSTGHSGIQTL